MSCAASAERGKLRIDNIAIFEEEATSAGFHASLLPWSNWNSETLVLWREENQRLQPKTKLIPIWN